MSAAETNSQHEMLALIERDAQALVRLARKTRDLMKKKDRLTAKYTVGDLRYRAKLIDRMAKDLLDLIR